MPVITRATPAGPRPAAAVPVTQQPTTTAPASPAQGGIPRVPDVVQTRMASPSGQSVLTTPTAEYMGQQRVLTASVASQPNQNGTKGTVVFAMQQHEQDPTSTIALEIKRAQTLFSKDPVQIQREITAQVEVVAFWMIRGKSSVLDALHCISEFSTETIGAPHPLKQKIIGFMGDRVEDQKKPGLLAPDNVFATQRERTPMLDILGQAWQTASDMTLFVTATNDMEMLAGIPLLCYILAAWVPVFLQGTWNPLTAIAWLASELATWPPDD
eukprot:scaffold99937_cov45-Attheya_sp.AAC.2